jgi:hypothetical protein
MPMRWTSENDQLVSISAPSPLATYTDMTQLLIKIIEVCAVQPDVRQIAERWRKSWSI